MAPHRAHNPGVLVRVQVPQPNMTDLKFESQENPTSLLHKIELAFEAPDPKVTERLKDRVPWVQKEASGRIYLRPPEEDKHPMLVLNTEDLELYNLFNSAAEQVTRKWDGFHQSGANDRNGLTCWEMWKTPDVSDDELLGEVKRVMIEIATEDVGS